MDQTDRQDERKASDLVLVECDNCDWTGEVRPWEPEDMPFDLIRRLDVGGEVPAAECPECGALAYLVRQSDPSTAGELRKRHTPAPPHIADALAIAADSRGPSDSEIAASEPTHILTTLRAVASIIEATYAHDDEGNRIETEAGMSGADCFQAVASQEHDIDRAITLAERSDALIRNAEAMQSALCDLVRWADYMGGWDAPAWDRARHLIARADETRDHTDGNPPSKHGSRSNDIKRER